MSQLPIIPSPSALNDVFREQVQKIGISVPGYVGGEYGNTGIAGGIVDRMRNTPSGEPATPYNTEQPPKKIISLTPGVIIFLVGFVALVFLFPKLKNWK